MTGFLIVLLITFVVIFFGTFALMLSGANEYRCPKCHEDMYYIGNDDDIGKPNGLPEELKHKYYKCPKCGNIIVV